MNARIRCFNTVIVLLVMKIQNIAFLDGAFRSAGLTIKTIELERFNRMYVLKISKIIFIYYFFCVK